MLWSDPPDEPPEELREVQAKLRRLGIVLAVVAVVVMLLLAGG
ncbi:morphogenic membrane protein MmpB [Streptomyces sioyaensis]